MKIKLTLSIPFLFLLVSCNQEMKSTSHYKTWEHYLGDPARTHYSSLDQFNKENTDQIEVAWTYNSGGASSSSVLQCNPLIKGNILYGVSPLLQVFALDAASGEELWTSRPVDKGGISRGLMYWEEGEDKRIIACIDRYLVALDALTGELIENFGEKGLLDLKKGLGRDVEAISLGATTPGVIYKNTLVQGFLTSESLPAVPGHIRGFDVKTGEQKWIFHTIPHPGEYGYETWPENAWVYSGGANNWSGMTLDEERGVVYIPLGSASSDFWGGDRLGDNLFANSLLALDALTGKRLWHFQSIKHDIWDRDMPAPPTLVTVELDGEQVDAIAQISKEGFVYLLNRDTGEPLYPMQEIEVPSSTLDGEIASKTQSIPTFPEPFVRQTMTVEDINNFSKDKDSLIGVFNSTIHTNLYDPLSEKETLVYPGTGGGGEWGGAGWDPESRLLYINANDIACIMKMVDVRQTSTAKLLFDQGQKVYARYCMGCHGIDRAGTVSNTQAFSLVNVAKRLTSDSILSTMEKGRNSMPAFKFLNEVQKQALLAYLVDDTVSLPVVSNDDFNDEPYKHTGYNRFLDSEGYPAHTPPWGTLNAIDLNTGKVKWQVPLGEYEELSAKGIPATGQHNYGGMVVTKGGLVFIGSTPDGYFRAFDKDTGEELWKYKLPFAAISSPATYEVNGVQYVVVAAGGGKTTKDRGDVYMAFRVK